MRRNRPLIGDIREQSYRDVEREYYANRSYFRYMIVLSLILGACFIYRVKLAEIRDSEPTISESEYLIQNLTKDDEDKPAPIYVYFSDDGFEDADQVIVLKEIREGSMPDYSNKDQLVTVSCTDPLRKSNMMTYLKKMGYTNVVPETEVFGEKNHSVSLLTNVGSVLE